MTSPKKVVNFLIAEIHKPGGTERAVVNLANDLAELGYTINIISVFTSGGTSFYALDASIAVFHLGITLEKNLLRRLLVGFKNVYSGIKQLYQSKSGEIFIATDPFVSFVLGSVNDRKNHVVVCEHMALSIAKKHSLILRKLFFKRIDAIVVLTWRDRIFMQELLPCIKSYHIPNRVTYPAVGLPSTHSNTLVAVGRLEPQKNFLELIDIFAAIHQREQNVKLLIAGQGAQETAIRNKINEYELDDVVEIRESVSDTKAFFHYASVYLMSSVYEGFPMVILEAMASGLPVVAYDCPNGPRELIEEGKSGYLAPLHDKDTFVSYTISLIRDEERRKRFGMKAQEIVREKYSKELISGKWDRLLKSL